MAATVKKELFPPPSPSDLRGAIDRLINTVDHETTKLKTFIKLLNNDIGNDVDLSPQKGFIKSAIIEALLDEDDSDNDEQHEEQDEDEVDSDDEIDSEEEGSDDDGSAEKKKMKKKEKKEGSGSGGGLNARKEISQELADFLGRGREMARTEIVKALWEYIREHNLQNPDNRREIFLDGPMKKVFGCDRFTMFTMNKYVGAHVFPFKPVDLTSNSSSSKPSTPRKRKQKDSSTGDAADKKKRKTGAQPPYRLSPELEAVVDANILPRPQVVKAIWDYIKSKALQNPEDKREIICDGKLEAIFKKAKVTMFEMNQLITKHLIEKLDKGAYQHKEEEYDRGSDDNVFEEDSD